jgi:hypothetical protein
MGQKIWGMLTDYEGRWVAVDKGGQVVAEAETLPDVMRAVGGREHRVTFLYAAAEAVEAESR